MRLKKSPGANLEKKRPMFFQIGLIIGLALSLAAFEWRVPDDGLEDYTFGGEDEITFEEEIPQTFRVEKPKPKVKIQQPSKSITVRAVTQVIEAVDPQDKPDNTDFFDDSKDDWMTQDPEPVSFVDDKPFIRVEDMPHSCECSHITNKDERKKCSDLKIIGHLQSSVSYPYDAKELGVSGTVYVAFVVNRKGKITKTKVARKVFPSLDKEALKAVKNLPCFVPGKQLGKTVKVQFTLPIKFALK